MRASAKPSWIASNPFIAAAMALPLLVMALFAAATVIPKILVDDPRYHLLFAVDHYDSGADRTALSYQVVDSKLIAQVRLRPVNNRYQRLFRFDADSQTVVEIQPQIPQAIQDALSAQADKELGQSSFPVAELASATLLNTPTAPDGYQFDAHYRGRRGLFGELFGMSSRRYQLRIGKQGRQIRLQPGSKRPYYYGSATLLGWVAQ